MRFGLFSNFLIEIADSNGGRESDARGKVDVAEGCQFFFGCGAFAFFFDGVENDDVAAAVVGNKTFCVL
jgi:hypothetical protein